MRSLNYWRMFFRYLKLLIRRQDTLRGTIEEMAARRGDAPCLLFEDERYSYGEFNRRANRRANFFRARGVGPGDVVGLLMENRPEYLETVLGLAKLGAVSAGINHNLRGAALVHSFQAGACGRAIVGAECLAAFHEAMAGEPCVPANEVYVDTRWPGDAPPPAESHDLTAALAGASEDNPPPVAMNSNDLFMYIYTSGTTGLPKAARISNLRWYGAGLAFGWYALNVRAEDVVYCPLPYYHSNGALIAWGAAMRNGAALAMSRRFSASEFWSDVRRHGATRIVYIGEVLRYVLQQPPAPDDRDHKVAYILGNGLRPDIWDAFRERFGIPHIREFYASTEGNAYLMNMADTPRSVGTSLIEPSNLLLVRYDVERDEYPRTPEGFCIPCAPGEVGELLGKIKGTTPFGGYTNDEDSNKKLLHGVLKRGDVYFKTGDLLKRDGEGNHYFIDRIGDTFRWKGENVSTQEVAEILATHPGVAIANVYGVEVPGTEGRAGMAALTLAEGHAFEPAAFHAFAAGALPPYARPLFVRLTPEQQVTGTYKLTKTELKRAGYDPALCGEPLYFAPPEGQGYQPLDAAAHGKLRAGEFRF